MVLYPLLRSLVCSLVVRSDDRDDNVNPLALIGMVILAPLAAAIIQMSISRTREYLADEGGLC